MPGASPGGTSQPTTYIEAMAAEAKAEEQVEREKAGLEGGWGAELATAKAEFDPGRERSGGQGGPLNPGRLLTAARTSVQHTRSILNDFRNHLELSVHVLAQQPPPAPPPAQPASRYKGEPCSSSIDCRGAAVLAGWQPPQVDSHPSWLKRLSSLPQVRAAAAL